MRFAALLWLSLTAVYSAEVKIDHVTIAGANLDSMRKAFTAATGIPTEYGGRHINHATEMALASFPDGSYVELMAIQTGADPAAVAAHVWSKFLKSNAGPCAFALRAPDLNAQVARLRSSGIGAKEPVRSGRTRPDGTRLEWETTDIGPGTRGGLFPFLIHDLTPRENRVYVSGKPTTGRMQGVSRVVIGVSNLDAAVAQYRKAFSLSPPRIQSDEKFGARIAWFEETPIVLAQGLNGNSWLSRRVREYGDAPCAFVVVLPNGAPGLISNGYLSKWFGQMIAWTGENELGWHFGIEGQ